MDEELRHKIYGLAYKAKAYPKDPNKNRDFDIIFNEKGIDNLLALIASYGREARIDELGGVQLEYGHYIAQTFVDGQALTIEERIKNLKEEPTHE